MRTAVVLLLTMPMAASSAMIAAMVEAGVSPGTAIMSRPTEHTHVIASSFSRLSAPLRAALIMPMSSLTGINAPDRPPTWLEAMTPPFLTASLSSASAAVVPWQPQASRPISSRMCATESPIAGVGASDRSTMPNGTPRRWEASLAMSWPTRVILKAVFLIVSATTSNGWSFASFSSACLTTPGPEMPTLMQQSPSPGPWNAPAMNGLSSTALAKTTSFMQPAASCSFVASAMSLTACPHRRTASMSMPARVEATLTDEQTRSVVESASGREAMSARSEGVMPFCTSAV